jgi:mRNA interferase RelE/StbE
VPEYQITFTTAARKELESLDARVGQRILVKIRALSLNPRPPSCVKLTGLKTLWRIRVGDWRVLYTIDDARLLVDIIAVRHRSDAYR